MLLLGEVGGAPSGSAAFLRAPLPAPTTQCCCPLPRLRLEPPAGGLLHPTGKRVLVDEELRGSEGARISPQRPEAKTLQGQEPCRPLQPAEPKAGGDDKQALGRVCDLLKGTSIRTKWGCPPSPALGQGLEEHRGDRGRGSPPPQRHRCEQTNHHRRKTGSRDNGEELPEGKPRWQGPEAPPQGPSPAGSPRPMGTPWCHPAGAGHAAAAGAE